MAKWDTYGLEEARHQARMSKDPSTAVGCCILRPDGTVASMGWNGFARGVLDSYERLNDRTVKLALTLHAEENAFHSSRENLAGYTLYVWPFQCCARCASAAIQNRISRIVAPVGQIPDRWQADFALARAVLGEAGVALDLVDVALPS
jgi:dCMP deaminase